MDDCFGQNHELAVSVAEIAVKRVLNQGSKGIVGKFGRLLHPFSALKRLQGPARVAAKQSVDTVRVVAEKQQCELRNSYPYVRRSTIVEGVERRFKLRWITIFFGILSVVAERKTQPILIAKKDAQIVTLYKIEHAKELLPLRVGHTGDHVLGIIEAGYREILASDLAQTP